MSPKWAKKAHCGDISYNVSNRRKSSVFDARDLNICYKMLTWPCYLKKIINTRQYFHKLSILKKHCLPGLGIPKHQVLPVSESVSSACSVDCHQCAWAWSVTRARFHVLGMSICLQLDDTFHGSHTHTSSLVSLSLGPASAFPVYSSFVSGLMTSFMELTYCLNCSINLCRVWHG